MTTGRRLREVCTGGPFQAGLKHQVGFGYVEIKGRAPELVRTGGEVWR